MDSLCSGLRFVLDCKNGTLESFGSLTFAARVCGNITKVLVETVHYNLLTANFHPDSNELSVESVVSLGWDARNLGDTGGASKLSRSASMFEVGLII